MSISGLSKEAGESQRESDQQDCAAITENMTSLAETKSKARVMVDCSTSNCIMDEMQALHECCSCQKQSAVKECTQMVGGKSNLFGCDSWWLLAILICVVQGWKWTDRGSVRPWGRGWWLTMVSLVAVAEGLADTWYQLSPTGGLSGSHIGGVSVWSTADNRMYVYGGDISGELDTLIAYDPQADEWATITPSSGTAPSKRAYSAGAWDETNGRMWIFGGYYGGTKYDDLHYYDVAGNAWVAVSPGGTAPAARYYHAAGFDSTNSRFWVFGGHDSTGSNRNDLHYYDVQANEWVEVSPGGTGGTVSPGGTAPGARNEHSGAWDSTNKRFWVFGGSVSGTGRSNDLHYYDLQAHTWVQVSPDGDAPAARYGQRAEWDDAGGRLWIIAGNTDAGSVNDLFYYDVQENKWVEVTPGGATLDVRQNHHSAIDASAGRLYVYAGASDGGVTLLYTEIEDITTTTTVSSSATHTSTSTSSATRTITTTTTQTISSSTTVTGSTTGTTTTTRTGSTTTTTTSSTSTSTTTSSSSSTSTTTSSSSSTSTTTSITTSTSTTTSSSTSTSTTTSSSTSTSSSTTTTSTTTSTSTSTTSTSTSRSATTSSSSTTSTTATSTSTSKTLSTTTSSASTTSKTSTQSSTTTKTLTTVTATHSTTTTSSISSSTTSRTTTTKTSTAIPKTGLTAEELEALENNRKEEAAQAVAAVEAAENNAVTEAIAALALQGSNASAPSAPGILGEVTISSPAGPVKVAALSLEAMGNDSAPVKVSAGGTGAELEVSAGLLGEVAAAAGGGVVLLSVAGLPKDAASRLATDDIRAKSPDPGPPGPGGARRLASALRSQPLSINFRAADGTKINVNNLTSPMRMTLTVEDPKATCAFWDEATAQWSSKGVQTISSEIPGILECETIHLSIFGGVVDVALRNFVLALECSTVGDLLTGKAIAKMVEDGEWLGRPVTLCTLAVAVGFLGLLKLASRSDQRFQETLPWSEREDFLMCVKAKASPQDPRAGAAGAGVTDAVEQPPQTDAEQHGKINDKGADEVQRDGDEQPRENREDEEVKNEEKEEERKDEAAGGLEDMPSIFRTVRGIVEGLLDTISQALGGENVLDSIKEVIGNAESGTIHRAIASLQSHRSGADQATVRALQRGDTLWASESEEALDADAEGERRRDATSERTEGSPEDLPLEGEKPVPVADEQPVADEEPVPDEEPVADEELVADKEASGRRKTSVVTLDVQSMNSENSAYRREVPSVHEAVPAREDGGAEVQGESRQPRPRASIVEMIGRPRASMVEMVGAALGAARRAKARAMHGRVAEDGAGAAKRYLEGNIISRALMLFPAVHNWLKLSQFSIVVPCVVRTELIELKVWSCACLNAAFFSSTIPAPNSDPACRPEAGSVAYWSQKIGVGVVSATAGDFIILLLFLLVRMRIEERVEWTDEDKARRRRQWRCRTIAFWIIAVLYKSFCIFYVCDFIANVSKEDAMQLLEATAMSLLQDLVLKPAILAIILSVVSTLVLNCRPSVERSIEAKWIEDGSAERVSTKDLRGSSTPSDACKASDVKEEGDGHRPLGPIRDPNEAQFAAVLPGMPGMS